jgi:hypothetical protein
MERKYLFKQLPNYFCVHFQRLRDNRVKYTTLVDFPSLIDFGQVLRVFATMICKLKDEKGEVQSKMFRLCSLIIHLSAQAGDQYETILLKNG